MQFYRTIECVSEIMKKLRLEIPLLLPEVPDEKDQCVHTLIELLSEQRGVEKVHVVQAGNDTVPHLCFHYDPNLISIDRVRSIAQRTGASITQKTGHKLIEVEGIRHPRHARVIERNLRSLNGILEVSVSASGMVRVEFDAGKTDETGIFKALRNEGLGIPDTAVNAERYLRGIREMAKDQKGEKRAGQEKQKEDEHVHGGIFGKNTELIFSIISGILLAFGFGLSFIQTLPSWVSLSLYIGAYLFGGFYTAKEAFETVIKGGFEIDFLMLVAAIGAAFLGKWAEGALLLFLFSMGHALEHYAMNKARKSIGALANLAPKTALLKRNETTEEVAIGMLTIGDIIVVKPHNKIPADGAVVKGESSVNQAPITGESVPVDKMPVPDSAKNLLGNKELKEENRVFAGTINGNNTLEVRVLKEAKDSTLSRLIKMVHEAQTQKSPTQRFTDKFEKYFVPAVLGMVLLLLGAFWVIDETFGDSFYRAMSVLVAASPCALAISTPSAVLSGVARAAQEGVLIKGGRALEDLGVLTALAFDKTGTLTEGKPKLTKVVSFNNMERNELLKIAVAVENLSDHPLARAVVRDGTKQLDGIAIPEAEHLESIIGKGVRATLGGDKIYIGNLQLYEYPNNHKPSQEIQEKVKTLEAGGNTTMLIRKNSDYVGIIALMDIPRQEAAKTLQELKKIGIKRMVMLTGDNQKVADAVAREIGIDDARGDLLPEEKVEVIKELKEKESKVAMIGDGVNDAPAMANSTVGIAMGAAGSDVALETADIALMADKLETLPFAIGLSRKAKNIIKQNVWISLGVVALLVPSTIFGLASMGIAVLIHEGSTLVVVFNALRLLAYKR